eukprot:TRINITY_DN3789_c0_g1_i1.p1 TRINITY_DN3789_c0_g1~~TRINITY_DN3789_c0_g1_i1.p1  ORF type:complete len:324 (-),score=52.65 TRINITY_DN3789_c0_g1_i1:71-1042(-)
MFPILSNISFGLPRNAASYILRRYSLSSSVYSRLWDASTVGDRSVWARPVPDVALNILRSRMFPSPFASQSSKNDVLNFSEISEGWKALKQEREDLSNRGFVLLQLPKDLSDADQKRMFWYLCQQLGRPLNKSLQDLEEGEKIYSLPLRSGFKTNQARSKAAYNNYDLVAFLCAKNSKNSAPSTDSNDQDDIDFYQLISGYTVFSQLSKNARAVLGQRAFNFINELVKEEANLLPVFQVKEDGGLTICYSREWLNWNSNGVMSSKLNVDQQKALEELEQVLEREHLRIEFRPQRGDMLIINNRWILNNSPDRNTVVLESLDLR